MADVSSGKAAGAEAGRDPRATGGGAGSLGGSAGNLGKPPRPLSPAERLLEEEEVERAIRLLATQQDTDGNTERLLGVAYFRLEKYGDAVQHLRRAVDAGQSDPELHRLLERAVANELGDVARPIPEPIVFDRATLLAGPKPGNHSEAAPSAREPQTPGQKLLSAVGELAGLEFGKTLGALTRLLGSERTSSSVWTGWYKESFVRSILMLAKRRDRLNREQLFAAYPKSVRTGFFGDPKGPTGEVAKQAPPAWTRGARSSDGSFTDLSDPMAGAAGVRFGYNTEPERTLGETDERLLTPNPRTVSRVLLTRNDGFKPVPFLNLTAACWIQFMNHDWVSHGDPDPVAEPYRIPLDEDDPVRRTLHQSHMLVRRTQTDPTREPGERATSHINEVTAWWDGSQIYGSDAKTADSLRSFSGGKLALDPRTGMLPVAEDGVEQTGFRRNWWVGLSMLHHLFVQEHNTICDMLARNYPSFDDQRLYDTARLINAAVMAKIHTVEWTPSILPNRALNAAMNSNWYGFLTNLFRSKGERRTLADINVADPIAGGLVGNATDTHGIPYSLSREFVAVYRLHSLLPDFVELYALGADQATSGPVQTLPIGHMRQRASHKLTQSIPMDELFYSFGRQHPGQLVLNNYPDSLQNLSIPGAGFYDLAAVDVLRDRERGVPRYNQFRRLLGLKPIQRFEDLTDDVEAVRALRSVYDSIEDIDLLVGNLAEAHRPTNFGFGETLFEIFILNASRRLQADRFFTEYYRADVYTSRGLEWIDHATLKTVLLRHYPRLHSTGLANIDNAFEPWDVGPLDPARHPLRQYDKELQRLDRERRFES